MGHLPTVVAHQPTTSAPMEHRPVSYLSNEHVAVQLQPSTTQAYQANRDPIGESTLRSCKAPLIHQATPGTGRLDLGWEALPTSTGIVESYMAALASPAAATQALPTVTVGAPTVNSQYP